MAVLPEGTSGARSASTHFRVLARGQLGGAPVALMRVRLETGRTHQIRVHLSHAGFAIAGDPVYAGPKAKGLFSRQALHAERLGLHHPQSRTEMHWQCDPPADLLELLATAGLAEERGA
jgi:23S rRNA pseudouridine1911/1915/1917 synthase